jgi:uncharacterized PurR-regulated membrane protein YhhQ (DUF165 family)
MFITAFYITIKLTAFVITYKVTDFRIFSACFSVLIIPVWFLTGDIIAEVYGYKIAKQLIWAVITCQIIMILLFYASSRTPSPYIFSHQSQTFKEMATTLTRGVVTNIMGIVVGGLVNARIIVFLKSMFHGKYFMGRCLVANAVGEGVFTIIAYSAGFFEVSQIPVILKLMAASYTIKFMISPLLIIPTAIVSRKLKVLELGTTSYANSGISKIFNNHAGLKS